MPHRQGSSLANPLIGLYFGVFAASLAAIVLLLLILEQLGANQRSLKIAMALAAIGLFSAAGAASYTGRPREFLLAGRRVPAFYNGLSLTVTAFGGAGLVGIAGALFLTGFDMLFLGLGLISGLTVMIMLIAPFLRKFGVPSVPAFLGLRFASSPVRLLAASIAVVPLMLALIAEIKIAMMAASWLLPLPPATVALLVIGALIVTVSPGGARSLSWSSAAQGMAVLVAVLVPAAIAAVMETNLPFGQLSHGPVLRSVGRAEMAQGVLVPLAGLLTLDIPSEGMQPIAGRFLTTFGSAGPAAFVLATLSILAGVAGSPMLLARSSTTASVYDTRKSIGWAVVLVGVLFITLAGIAVFERHVLLSGFEGKPSGSLAAALQRLTDLGLAAVGPGQPLQSLQGLRFERDGVLVALPVLLGMPGVVADLVSAGVLAAALAGAGASLTQLGIITGEDVVNAPESWRASDTTRLTICRLAIVAAAVLAGAAAVLAKGDPLVLALHALAISGSALFPVLVMAIWWKRMTSAGAFAGLAAGFAVAVAVILMTEVGAIGLPPLLAPVLAVPFAVAAIVIASHLTAMPGRHMLEIVRDLRIPGGEPIHDREIRLARQQSQRSG